MFALEYIFSCVSECDTQLAHRARNQDEPQWSLRYNAVSACMYIIASFQIESIDMLCAEGKHQKKRTKKTKPKRKWIKTFRDSFAIASDAVTTSHIYLYVNVVIILALYGMILLIRCLINLQRGKERERERLRMHSKLPHCYAAVCTD